MKCEGCLRLLEPYLDGEVEGRDSAAVATHLMACASCSREYSALREEQALYLLHRCDATESPAFWDDLLTKVRAERPADDETPAARLRRRLAPMLSALAAPRFSPTVTAALLLAAVSLTALVMKYAGTRPEAPAVALAPRGPEATAPVLTSTPEAPAQVVAGEVGSNRSAREPVPATPVVEPRRRDSRAASSDTAATKNDSRPRALTPGEGGADKLVREAERKYLAAINILSRDVGRRRTRMDQEKLARFDRTLAVIDRAINETRGAAREHPRDPQVVQYMLAAYAKKVEVLREMAQD